jgi:hypothetical protein
MDSSDEMELLTAEEIAEEVDYLSDTFWNEGLDDGQLAFMTQHAPETLIEWQTDYAARHRPPTRQEIVQKMNSPAYPDDGWESTFQVGLRHILGHAICLPRDTDYAAHFNLEKRSRLFWYNRMDRHTCYGGQSRASALAIEADYPQEVNEDIPWGRRSGEIAAVRWLSNSDRQAADEWFPMLDS